MNRKNPNGWAWLLILPLAFAGCQTTPPESESPTLIPKWSTFERAFTSSQTYQHPLQQVTMQVVFTSPTGVTRTIDAFWDGGQTWRVRFQPDLPGTWTYQTYCSDASNSGLHQLQGEFLCTAPNFRTRFGQHGPVEVSSNGRYLEHQDGTPFFWMADTAWNGALHSTSQEWTRYLRTRRNQNFTAIQWVTTQWRAAPQGDRHSRLAFTGTEQIAINPDFFQRLDEKVQAVNEAGLVNAPVLLWAISGGSNPEVNPGYGLPEDQAILLARYMVARWGAYDVAWLLGGDGDYRGPKAERWKRIGRAVFGDRHHDPVALHPGGKHWNLPEFQQEPWLDIIGYQSGHSVSEDTLGWLINGPPATDWTKEPYRPFINLEPNYENHIGYQSGEPISPFAIRRAAYWSLLNAPTAGVSYGGHGVWSWSTSHRPPVDHPNSGVPFPWEKALHMPGADQMKHVAEIFTDIPFWSLRPAPEILAYQPGKESPERYIMASRSTYGDVAVVYVPQDTSVELHMKQLPAGVTGTWVNPRTGDKSEATAVVNIDKVQFATPNKGDWVLLLRSEQN